MWNFRLLSSLNMKNLDYKMFTSVTFNTVIIKVDFYIALFHIHAQSASHIITQAGLCNSTYTVYSFSVSTLENTVPIAADYTR